QRARGGDERVGELGAQELKGQLDVVVANRVRLLGLRRRGQHEDAPRVARQRAGEEDVVDRSLRLGDGGDRIERRQVQERRHVAALQVEVDERDVRPGQGGEREGQVDGQRGGDRKSTRLNSSHQIISY